MSKDAQRNIFPWVRAGLLILSAGSAAAAPPQPSPHPAAAAPIETSLPADQVWQCDVNGQKVFSDKRCGTGASIRQLNAVNGMDPPLPLHAPQYPTAYGQGPSYPPVPSYAPLQTHDPDSSQDSQSSSDVYAANQYMVFDERRRREHHASRPQNHSAVHAHTTR